MPGPSELAQVDMTAIYIIVGTLVVTNLGAIISLFKVVFHAGKVMQTIDRLKQDNNQAHKKIRDLENKINDL